MADGFSVEGVQVEGFKGFASSTYIDFQGRHVFLLGENGNGKSSIVEAVRWGLFGSAYRPNEIVKNQHYTGECRVTVKLMRDGTTWNLSRTLNLGTDRTSDPVLTDQNGKRQPIRKILPQLDSVDAGEGTHIIFAPQSAPLRRQPEDLGPFERTVFNYLGLTRPRALLSSVNAFLEEQSEAVHALDAEMADARDNIDDQIAQQEAVRNSLLTAAPWGDELTPSISSSELKVRTFIQDINPDASGEDSRSLSLDSLIERADETLSERRVKNEGELTAQAHDLARYRGHLEELGGIRSQISRHESMISDNRRELDDLYGGLSLDDLRGRLRDARFAATTESLREKLAQDALDLLSRQDSTAVACPICRSQHERESILVVLNDIVGQSTSAIDAEVSSRQGRVNKAEELEQQLRQEKEQLQLLTSDLQAAMSLVSEKDKDKLATAVDIDELIEVYTETESLVKSQIRDHESWHASARAKLIRLKDEYRFHRIQRQLADLQTQRTELERAIDEYRGFVAFGESVKKIRDEVASQLSEQLARDLPRVSETLSKAFSALTKHPWYDRLVLVESDNAKLEIRVASSKDPAGREDPTGVLNGQAESALDLVPYFAFSQADGTPTEVYLVMLDDPTRALDTQHIVILLDELKDLGRNVQLIVASQETERFREMLPNVFDSDSYVVIEPTGWSPDRGPELRYR